MIIIHFMTEITKGMKSIGPKYFYKYKNISIIEYQIKQLKKHRCFNNVHLMTGFGHEKIKKNITDQQINIIYNNNYFSQEMGGNFQLVLNSLDLDNGILFINNGIITKINWNKYIDPNHNSIFYLNKKNNNFNIGFNSIDNLYLFYDLPIPWAEIFYLNGPTLKNIKNSNLKISNNLFLFEIINMLYNNGVVFNTINLPNNKIFKFNSPKDHYKLARFVI